MGVYKQSTVDIICGTGLFTLKLKSKKVIDGDNDDGGNKDDEFVIYIALTLLPLSVAHITVFVNMLRSIHSSYRLSLSYLFRQPLDIHSISLSKHANSSSLSPPSSSIIFQSRLFHRCFPPWTSPHILQD